MARLWNATSDRLSNTTSGLIPTTGTISFWVYPTWAQNDGANHVFYSADVDASNNFRAQKFTDNNLYFGWTTTGTTHRVTVLNANYTLTQNAWNHFLLDWDDTANTLNLFLNGASIGSFSTSLVTHTSGTFVLGNTAAAIASINMAGRLAEVGLYNVVLDAGERGVLADGFSPLLVRPASLVALWPIIGRFSPEVSPKNSAHAMTVSGTAAADHPRIILPHPGRGRRYTTEVVAGGDAVPQAWMQYRARRVA